MLIEDLKQISEKLYEAALHNQAAQGNERNERIKLNYGCVSGNFTWGVSPQGDDFWRAVVKDLDKARAIDKEHGWGLFEEDKKVEFVVGKQYKIKAWFNCAEDIGIVVTCYEEYGHDFSFHTNGHVRSYHCDLSDIGTNAILISVEETADIEQAKKISANTKSISKASGWVVRKLLHPDSVLAKAEQHPDKHLHELTKPEVKRVKIIGNGEWVTGGSGRER